MGGAPDFDTGFRDRLADLLAWRRDVRRFRTDTLPPGALERLIGLACLAPSVGLSQPWRFVVVDNVSRRNAVRENFRACNADALAAYHGERAQRYATLKLAGLDEAPAHVAVFADHGTEQGYGAGRRTMPETADYSVVAAIHTLWLAARAEDIGIGWVSILDPTAINDALDVPKDWSFIAYLCIGYPQEGSSVPELERVGWEYRRTPEEFILRR
ncbi:MAG: 5,6-dimethylbenzimidazole synthase [Alphaproteobacteria bacterium]|nr:5,6-dimethylbenzimidazole synthase [Alphaproteobacteria bacterium]